MALSRCKPILLVLVLIPGGVLAQPSNDNCASAKVITTLPFADSVNTTLATTEAGDPVGTCGSASHANSVWYRFTAPATGPVSIDTFGSNYDTVVNVFTGACGSFTDVACDDDSNFGLQSIIHFTVTSGTTYYIVVYDFNSGGGNLVFHMGASPPDSNIGGTPPYCGSAGGAMAFVNDAGPGSTYQWGIIDGTITGQGTRTVTFTPVSDPFNLFVRIVDGTGAASSEGSRLFSLTPPAQISAPTPYAYSPSTASVFNTAGAAFSWSVTNGRIIAGATSATLTYRAGGSTTSGITSNVALGGCTSQGTFSPLIIPTGDFFSSFYNDLVFRNYSTGQNAVWRLVSTFFLSVVDLPALPNVNFRIEGTNDFNGDRKTDILLRNYSTGQNAVWIMNGTALSAIVDLPGLSTAFRFEGTGDFNGDGKPDILLRNYSTGQNALWIMNGTTLTSVVDLPALADANWHFVGGGDFNGDGNLDILLRNFSTGRNAVWLLNGTSFSSVLDLPALPDVNYMAEAVGDFNFDGKTDIVFRNYTPAGPGNIAVWRMNGATLLGITDLPAISNLSYHVAGPR